jgi:aspartate carbamoyltransferase catalytic subunit
MNHIVSAEQFTQENLSYFFNKARDLRDHDTGYLSEGIRNASRRNLAERHVGRQMVSLFYEPSTRTRGSFELAGAKFGMGLFSTENAREFSSASKGETLEDTIRVLNEYHTDILVMRHHETGAAVRAAAVAADHMHIINAGDGKGEHPTQALLDAYTIYEHFDRLDNLKLVMGGDLKQGRTVRSLARVAALYPGNHITFVSTPEFRMGDDIKEYLDKTGTTCTETDDVHGAVQHADVVYWTRLQKERLERGSSPEQIKEFVIDQSVLDVMDPNAIIMHPLPRVGEITPEVDTDPRAKYFRQAGNGLYTRMALLDYFLRGQS